MTNETTQGEGGAALERFKALSEHKHRFLDEVDPFRADLYRYCRALTESVWDAEDLLQDVLVKGFAVLAERHGGVSDLRAYLFRAATNTWIDRQRRREPVFLPDDALPDAAAPERPTPPEVREALCALARRLPPRARVAVLLRDVFGFTIADVAGALDTSRGAVKAALHRGRAVLTADSGEGAAPATRAARRPSDELLDELVAAFTAKDVPRLVALMLPDATSDIVGVARDVPESETSGTFVHTVAEDTLVRAEAVEIDGERVLLLWYATETEDGVVESIGDVAVVTESDGRCARLRFYYYCPEVLEEVARALGAEPRTNGSHY